MKPPYAIGSVPSLSGHAIAYRWRSLPRVRRHRASKPQGSSERVLPWQITMDQLIFASLSHTHYWYELGMLKVPARSKMGEKSCVTFLLLLCDPGWYVHKQPDVQNNKWVENTHKHTHTRWPIPLAWSAEQRGKEKKKGPQ